MSHYQNFTPPFVIPDSWEWVRLEEIAQSNIGLTYKTYGCSKAWNPCIRIKQYSNRGICKCIVRRNSKILFQINFLHEGIY